MNLVIRRATVDDIEAMYRLSCKVHRDSYSELIPVEQRNRFMKAYDYSQKGHDRKRACYLKDMNDPDWFTWAAECDGKLAGFARGYRTNDHTLIESGLFVDPSYRGRGIGEALFRRALASAKPGDTAQLSVIENNERAKRLYRKHGFKQKGMADKTFYGAKMIVMTKHID